MSLLVEQWRCRWEPQGGVVKFTLARGTAHMRTAEKIVTVVDTTEYDVLLGTEFMAALGRAYDTYTEMFKCKLIGSDGKLNSHKISAPCHSPSPIIAYACL